MGPVKQAVLEGCDEVIVTKEYLKDKSFWEIINVLKVKDLTVVDNEHHFVDMVFYHRLLHCTVLIEVKTERFHHAHAGQLNMYLEYYKKYEMVEGDNPPVGILLCTDKDQ